jgi:hypothetical protein
LSLGLSLLQPLLLLLGLLRLLLSLLLSDLLLLFLLLLGELLLLLSSEKKTSVSRKATTTFRNVFAQKCYLLNSVPDLLALGLFVLQPLELLLLLPALLPPFVDVLPQLKIKYIYNTNTSPNLRSNSSKE